MPSRTIEEAVRRYRPFHGAGRGGKDGGGRIPPRPPGGDDLWDFLQFVYLLLQVWTRRATGKDEVARRVIRKDELEFDLDRDTRTAIQRGWEHFSQQWELHADELKVTLRDLDLADLDKRGLRGPALQMKLHLVRTGRDQLVRLIGSIREFLPETSLVVRKSWNKLFGSVDTILDSVVNAVPLAGNGLASGLKEFKEFSMDVSEPE
jgi:hypothetical protein